MNKVYCRDCAYYDGFGFCSKIENRVYIDTAHSRKQVMLTINSINGKNDCKDFKEHKTFMGLIKLIIDDIKLMLGRG